MKKKSDKEWKEKLSPQQYYILREKGTEPPFSGTLYHNKDDGMYHCAACGSPLFKSDTKYDSGSGWPSFYEPVSKEAISEHSDDSLGMKRTEITCSNCGGHLGHVFPDGPNPTGLRYCVNSVSMDFKKKT
jgi:peptide-methionine (R)-S-oxide reductase